MLVITADVFERRSGVPQMLEELGAQVDVVALSRGDYVVGPETIVERKTVHDLHLSIRSGRLWSQLNGLRAGARWPCLVIEGEELEGEELFVGPIHTDGVRDARLAVHGLGITIIRTQDANDTAASLHRLALRRAAGGVGTRPNYVLRPPSPTITPAEMAIAAAPDISFVPARRVLARFGSLRHICEASPNDLQSVPGIGIKRAESIHSLVHETWDAPATDLSRSV